jgi:drug/metabolite transporter (DMT)-like permease
MRFLKNPHVRLFAGATITSFAAVFVSLVNVSPTASGFYRVLFGGIALTAFLLLTGRKLTLPRVAWMAVFLSAVFFALDLWFWHRSILYVGPGLGTLLANMQVFFMIAAGVLFLGQRPSRRQVIAIPLAIIGLAMVVGLDWSVLSVDYRAGVILGLLTAVCFAGYMLFMRQALLQTSNTIPIREVAVMSFLVAVMLGAAALVEGDSLVIATAADAGWLLAYGLLSHSVGLMLIASSLAKVSTTEVGLALLLQPSLSFVWDILFFGRTITAIEVTGAVIALLAIFLGSTRGSKQAQRPA